MRREAFDDKDTAQERLDGTFVKFNTAEPWIGLRFPSDMTAARTLELHEGANWANVHPDLKTAVAHFIEGARKKGICLYVRKAFDPDEKHHKDGLAVTVRHTRFGALLTYEEWEYLARILRNTEKQLSLNVSFVGYRATDNIPGQIHLYGRRPRVDLSLPPVRKTPRGLLKDAATTDRRYLDYADSPSYVAQDDL